MTDRINMTAYARMLCGLDPMLDQTGIESQPANNDPLSNSNKIREDRTRAWQDNNRTASGAE